MMYMSSALLCDATSLVVNVFDMMGLTVLGLLSYCLEWVLQR